MLPVDVHSLSLRVAVERRVYPGQTLCETLLLLACVSYGIRNSDQIALPRARGNTIPLPCHYSLRDILHYTSGPRGRPQWARLPRRAHREKQVPQPVPRERLYQHRAEAVCSVCGQTFRYTPCVRDQSLFRAPHNTARCAPTHNWWRPQRSRSPSSRLRASTTLPSACRPARRAR